MSTRCIFVEKEKWRDGNRGMGIEGKRREKNGGSVWGK